MAKNSYIQQRMERDRQYFDAGMRTGCQLTTDFICETLRDPNVMGKTRVLSRESIEKIFAHCTKLDAYYHMAFSDHVEADYVREKWDSVMRDIFGDDADPFEKRYPYAKEIKYLKPQKGWVD